MKKVRGNLAILIRQELQEVIHSKLLWLISSIYLVFFLIFVLVGANESNILGFTGMSRVLFSWSHALVFFLPLLALTTSSTVITQYRENGSLEFFLSQPVSRERFFLALTLARLMALLIPLVVMLFLTIIGGMILESDFRIDYGVKFFLIGSSLIGCFLSIGLYLSEKSRSQVRSIVFMILIWIAAVTFIDFILIGLVLQFGFNSSFFFLLTELSPIQAARLSLLMELDSSLSTLGSVGFYIVHHVGKTAVLTIGILWPLALGMIFWLLAKKNFNKNDLI